MLAAFVVIGIALFATVDDSHSGTSAASDQTTTTVAGDEPCGGAAAVPAAVKSSSVGGLSGAANLYDVTNVRIAASDPTWGRFSTVPKAGQESNFQSGYGVVQCTLIGWSVNAVRVVAGGLFGDRRATGAGAYGPAARLPVLIPAPGRIRTAMSAAPRAPCRRGSSCALRS